MFFQNSQKVFNIFEKIGTPGREVGASSPLGASVPTCFLFLFLFVHFHIFCQFWGFSGRPWAYPGLPSLRGPKDFEFVNLFSLIFFCFLMLRIHF